VKFDPSVHRRKTRPKHVYTFRRSVRIEQPRERVFNFCLDGQNFQKISPNRVEPVKETDEIIVRLNHVYPFRQYTAGVPMRWTMHVVELEPYERFVDELLAGPMRYVRHIHLFEALAPAATLYTDVLEYWPYGGAVAQHIFVKKEMARTFEHRQREMKRLLEEPSPNG
jgi:ligand-binding SRPBCC domain-containing protein